MGRSEGDSTMTLLLTALFGASGCLARWGVEEAAQRRAIVARPFATMWVNVSGAAISGFFIFVIERNSTYSPHLQQFVHHYVLTGFCGGFTTFSSALAIPYLDWRMGHRLRAATLVAATPLLCILGFWIGELLSMPLL